MLLFALPVFVGQLFQQLYNAFDAWCVIRVSYITVALQFVNELTTVSWAYPLTWALSSIIFLIYFLMADWMHGYDRAEAKRKEQTL